MKCIVFTCLCLSLLRANAQKTDYTIGDTLPEITLTRLYGMEGAQKKLNSFYSKLLILDFWGTWCEPCVMAIPKLDSLQKKYAGRLNILPVSDEKYDVVKTTMQNNPHLKSVSLPSVTDDSKLNNMFKHRMVPHEVWVNEKGIVVAITSHLDVTEANIEDALQGRTAGIPVKQDEYDFDLNSPFVKICGQNNNVLPQNLVSDYSVLLNYRPGFPAAIRLWVPEIKAAQNSSENIFYMNGITCINSRIISLFIQAFELTYTRTLSTKLNPNRIILDVYDSLKYMEHTDTSHEYTDAFLRTHCISYEMKLSKPIADTLFGLKMLEDLNRRFELKGRIVKREEPCWILIKKDARADTLKARPGTPSLIVREDCLGIRNKYLRVLFSYINAFGTVAPILDETGIDHPVDLDLFIRQLFDYDPDIDQIRKSLDKAGLDIVPARRTVNMLYLTDKPENY